MHRKIQTLALAATLILSSTAFAAALPAYGAAPEDVPSPLRPWIDWVLHAVPDARCPRLDGAGERSCTFASELAMSIDDGGATFHAHASAYRDGATLVLPGQAGSWPQDVRIDGVAAPVVAREGRPRILLAAGAHRIEGRLGWQRAPAQIEVPSEYASVAVTLRGRPVRPDDAGIVWLAHPQATPVQAPPVEADSSSTRIFRRVTDDVPAQVETAIELNVAGRPREIVVPMALLPGFTALQLRGPVPIRLDADGSGLRVQAVAGKSWVHVVGRQDSPIGELRLPAGGEPEIWSFAAVDEVRRVEVQGPAAVDPRQADVPSEWQQLPAWRVAPGQALKITQRHRGDASQSEGHLVLSRTLWLDEDGGALTFRDRLNGDYQGPQGAARQAGAPWRLNMLAPYQLGRAALGGQDQYLTRDAANGQAGLEVRGASLSLLAEGRLAAPSASLPVAGWSTDLQGASAELNVPPGWRLIHAGGVEHAIGAWTERWSLWDLFLALLICIAAVRVFGWLTGAVLAVALALTWTVPGAPGWWWFAPVIGAGAQQVAQRLGTMQPAAMLIKHASLVAVGIGIVIFSVGQLRSAVNPVLEEAAAAAARVDAARDLREQAAQVLDAAAENRPATAALMEESRLAAEANGIKAKALSGQAAPSDLARFSAQVSSPAPAPERKVQKFESVDPAAKVQTGPGVPLWHWRSYRLTWDGPIKADQAMRLWLAPPWMVRFGSVAGVLLLLAALWLMAGRPRSLSRGPDAGAGGARMPVVDLGNGAADRAGPIAAGLMLSAALGALLLAPAAPVRAQSDRDAPAQRRLEMPRTGSDGWQALMQQLRERLLEAPACAPSCAGVSRLTIGAHGDTVELRMQVQAQAESVLLLPGGAAWRAARNEIDGHQGEFTDRGQREVAVRVPPGVHVVTRTMSAAGVGEIALALPSAPGSIDASLQGWSLAGLNEDGTSDGSLNLTRAQRAGARPPAAAAGGDAGVPPFARIERTLSFGTRWHVETTVQRLDGGSRPQAVQVPLLPGEAVTAANVKVADGAAQLTLPAGARVEFSSDLEIKSPIALQASKRSGQFEVWNVEATTLWSVTTDGIAPVLRVRNGAWSPQWRPWPGESAILSIQRPEGVAGSTLTIDEAQLNASPGEKSTDTRATVVIRASLAGPHRFKLPAGAKLLTLAKDGRELPVYTEGDSVPLQIEPGTHRIEMTWREDRGATASFAAPRLDLGAPAVNLAVSSSVPQDRWVLWAAGPATGPSVMAWALLLVLAGLAALGARITASPLSLAGWIVLAIGAGQAGFLPALAVLGFLVATGLRERIGARLAGAAFNLAQIAYVVFAGVAVAALLKVVHHGLLGHPAMMVQGWGSSDHLLRWYQDRSGGLTPQATVLSLPVWTWRGLMLAWSVWLAMSGVKFARWVWAAFSAAGRWQRFGWRFGSKVPAPQPDRA
jgi:hypothetical protein